MRINLNWKYVFIVLMVVGFILPFIDYLTIIEMFFLLIPFGIIVIASLIYLIVSLFIEKLDTRKSLYFFLIIPVFALSQLFSGFSVDKIQRYRSTKIINELETWGKIPDNFDLKFGLEYRKSEAETKYTISYTRGFMVTKKYDSKTKEWKSYGWND